MEAIFGRNGEFLAWLQDGYIYNEEGIKLAYSVDNYFYGANNNVYLGFFYSDKTIRDKTGKLIGFTKSSTISSIKLPLCTFPPSPPSLTISENSKNPMKPLKISLILNVWGLSWNDFINQKV